MNKVTNTGSRLPTYYNPRTVILSILEPLAEGLGMRVLETVERGEDQKTRTSFGLTGDTQISLFTVAYPSTQISFGDWNRCYGSMEELARVVRDALGEDQVKAYLATQLHKVEGENENEIISFFQYGFACLALAVVIGLWFEASFSQTALLTFLIIGWRHSEAIMAWGCRMWGVR